MTVTLALRDYLRARVTKVTRPPYFDQIDPTILIINYLQFFIDINHFGVLVIAEDFDNLTSYRLQRRV